MEFLLFDHFRQFCKIAATWQSQRKRQQTHRELSRVSLWKSPGFYQTPKTTWGPTQPWGNGSRGRTLGLVLWALPVARCKLCSSQAGGNRASGKELPLHAGTLLSMEFPWVLMESSYGFFQVQINKKLTGLLWACAATSKQPGDLPDCLKSHPGREELLHPYVCMEVCVYIHTYTMQNRKRIFLPNFTN